MQPEEKEKCHYIIHTAAAAAAAGNLVPIPGAGVAADLTALVGMAISLAGVFGDNLTAAAAEAAVISEIKRQVLKRPLAYFAKNIPGLNLILGPTVSFVLVEAAGWTLAEQFDAASCNRRAA